MGTREMFLVFSENMQRKASQTTVVGSVFHKLSFSKTAAPAVRSEGAGGRVYPVYRKTGSRREIYFSTKVVSLFCFFPLLMGFKVHITEGKVQGLEKDIRPEIEAQRF